LREQHLQAVRAVKSLCNAEVHGDELHSKELKFIPNEISKKKLNIKISTAGSTALVLQTLFLASLGNDLRIRIDGGGTWNLHAPSIVYLQEVFLPLLEKIGLSNKIDVVRNGFYPKGGSIVNANIKKSKLGCLDLMERGELNGIRLFSIASEHLKKAQVAERQSKSAVDIIGGHFPDIKIKRKIDYVDALSPGSGILVVANYENTIIGFDVVGERGKQSEVVGREAGEGLMKILKSRASVDDFMLDQILPFLALSNGGKFKFNKMTEHAKTNIEIIKKFLDVEFKVEDCVIEVIS
ncbi:MAG: RNA 3'-terminal phosphate cyclase, partial [Nanoarchaeota archaeon]